LVASLLLSLAAGAPLAAATVAVTLSPSSATVQGGVGVGVTSKVTGASDTSVIWYVDGIRGGNSTVGTLSGTGTATTYRTPSVAGVHTVKVVSNADTTKSASSVVTVTAPVAVTLSPSSATVTAGVGVGVTSKVTGATDTSVTWYVDGIVGGNSTVGSLSGTGTATTYRTPSVAGVHTVKVVSNADTTKSASAAVTVTNPVAVAVSPTSATVSTGAKASLSSTVTGSANTAVTWSVDGVLNGNATVGTITVAGNIATYTSSTTAGSHSVKCTSTADTTKTATAIMTVVAPATVSSVAVSPATLNLTTGGQNQFSAAVTGTGSFNPAVAWSAQRGTITSTGLYTAPPTGGSDVVTAASVVTPSVASTASITVTAPSAAPAAPVLSGPVELQAGSGPYTVTAAIGTGCTTLWSITGGTLLSSPSASSALFEAGSGPYVTLTCQVSNAAGSATSNWWMVALPFAPRNHLADLKGSLTANSAEIASEVASGNPATYYYTSYYLHGMAAAAEATGDTQVMDALVGYITQMISLAQPLVRNGVTYQEWGPWDANSNPQQLNTFQGAGPLARTAAIIANNPAFLARYSTNLAQIVAFVDQSVFKYWFDKQTGVYANPDSSWLGGMVPWLPISLGGWGEATDAAYWLDKCSHLGMMSAWMYQATKNPLYLEYATRIAEGFKMHVSVVNGRWIWDYGTVTPAIQSDNLDGSPDTSHANREPMMVASMYEAGIYFQLADLQAMAATFSDLIWNQSLTNPMFSNYIDGGNLAYGSYLPWTDGNIYHGMNVLGKYSPKALLALALTDQIMETPGEDTLNASMPTNCTPQGQIEMAGIQALNILR